MAIARNNEQTVRLLLSHGADPVPRNYAERQTFERILRTADPKFAKELLLAPNQDLPTNTVIEAARLLGENEVLARLKILEDREPDICELRPAIDLAAERGILKVFQRLVDHAHHCALDEDVYQWGLSGTARRGQTEMFKILWAHLLEDSPKRSRQLESSSADLGGTRSFLSNPHAESPGQLTRLTSLLQDAAKGGSTDIFQLILAEGPGETTGEFETPDEAFGDAGSPRPRSVRATAKLQSVASEIHAHGAYYLNAAVQAGQTNMVHLLLRLGAYVNATGPQSDNQNALCTALLHKRGYDIVNVLLKGGADVNIE